MLACELFNGFDEELANERLYAKKILHELIDSLISTPNYVLVKTREFELEF